MANVNCTVYFRENGTSKMYSVGQAKGRLGSYGIRWYEGKRQRQRQKIIGEYSAATAAKLRKEFELRKAASPKANSAVLAEGSPFANGLTRIYRPRVITRRIAAQSGVFTVHKVLSGEHFVSLEKNRHFAGRLVKFNIPASIFTNLRKHLNGCGVNRFTLFPDLNGLCTHLAWRYMQRAP